MNSSTISSGNNENLSNNSSSMGPSSKKRKLSMGEMSSTNIELEILRSTIEKWKQYAQKLEAEKLQHIDECNQEKILEQQDTISKLQSMNAELQANNEHHQSETQSIINENTAKIKTFEDQKKQFESKIQELTDEISSMKTIKSEIKDSVENERENVQNERAKLKAEINELKKQAETFEDEKKELESKIKELDDQLSTMKMIKSEIKDSVESERETCQTEIHTLKAEIKLLKDKNCVLETKAQKAECILLNSEKKNKEMEKKCDKTTVANQKLEKKCKTLEATISKFQTIIDGLKTEKQELKNRIQVLENKEREKIVSLDEVSDGSKLNLSLFSCKPNIIIKVSKIDGSSPEGWKLYSTLNESDIPRLLTEKDMMDACFKMNITDQFIASKSGPNFHHIMRKINICELTKLELGSLQINFLDYLKLVSSKKVQICILKSSTVIKDQNKCEMDELLMHLPSLTEFKYHCDHLIQNFSTIAKNLGQLDPFPNLQKFEISHSWDALSLDDLHSFIKKNNKDISYVFKFPLVQQKSLQSKIRSSEKRLIKSLSLPYDIKVDLPPCCAPRQRCPGKNPFSSQCRNLAQLIIGRNRNRRVTKAS